MNSHRPNIVIISTHDSGRHFGCYGVPSVHTPNIDQLAAEGLRFDRMFAIETICSPSRCGLLTGLYSQTNGQTGLAGGLWNTEMHDTKKHLSHILRDRGYHTALIGLQHETTDPAATMGFDRILAHPLPPAPEVGKAAAQFIAEQANSEQPFYAQVGFFETHTPYDRFNIKPDLEKGVWVPPDIVDNQEAREHLARLQGALRSADEGVGQVLAALREAGLEDNTLVLYTTDHGVELPGHKWFLRDGGVGVAFIMRWPEGGVSGGKTCQALRSNIDFVPTLLETLGITVPWQLEGESFASELRNNQIPDRDEVFFSFCLGSMRGVRTNRYKLIRTFQPEPWLHLPGDLSCPRDRSRPLPAVELYDLEADPLELINIAENPDAAEPRKQMSDRLWRWLEAVKDPILHGPMPTSAWYRGIADYPGVASKD
ncbi:MAG: sulfatase [Planctomycetes bacterium]|nr:sulfatase [Planctomycetota bacterium]